MNSLRVAGVEPAIPREFCREATFRFESKAPIATPVERQRPRGATGHGRQAWRTGRHAKVAQAAARREAR